MSWINVVCLVGRLASDPKRKTTAGGTEYATMRVAVPRSAEHTDFFTVECWGKLAKVVLQHLTAGRVVSLRCELRHNEWTAGSDRHERVTLVARDLGFIGHAPAASAEPETEAA